MSIHGMIDERLRQALADALEPLIARLEAAERQLQAGTKPVTTAPVATAPVQYASGGLVSDEPEPEPLPEGAHQEPEKTAPRKRVPRKTATPDA